MQVVPPGAKSSGDMMRDLLKNKTIAFIGDSINNLVFRAFLCEIAKEDYITHRVGSICAAVSGTTFTAARTICSRQRRCQSICPSAAEQMHTAKACCGLRSAFRPQLSSGTNEPGRFTFLGRS